MALPPVRSWFTSQDGVAARLQPQPTFHTLPWAESDPPPSGVGQVIRLDPARRMQSILGFGSSFEEASVYHLARMSVATRRRVLTDLLHPTEGIGWNLMRICFGSSDFTGRPYYTYDDLPPGETDPDLAHFSIQHDIDYHILDILREAQSINPAVKFFASPWSPPGWMKSEGQLGGGWLLPQYAAVAARYYRRAVQAYAAECVPIHALTLQNEPLMAHPGYPTCAFTWEEQSALLHHVHAEFSAHGLDTEIWIFDHNFSDVLDFAGSILADAPSYPMVDGVALHDYEGEPEQMGQLHDRFPAKDIYFTERSTWGAAGIDRILQYLRHWARSYTAWVTCLDDRQQPNAGPHPCDPTFVTVDRDDPERYHYIPEYYLLGQISRFVQRGARRIAGDYGSADTVTTAAFSNPDGSTVLVAVNQTAREQPFAALFPGGQVRAALPAETVGTFVW